MQISNFTNYKITRFDALHYKTCSEKLVADLTSVNLVYTLEVSVSNFSSDTSYPELKQPQPHDKYSLQDKWAI
jgi:hypothetical protein